ncbi:MAG: hypothetical protein AAGM33_08050 [Pseudomonadota bacterium]
MSACVATPALADDGGAVLLNSSAVAKDIPSQIKKKQSRHYRALFDALEANQWPKVQALISDAPDSPLKAIAKAEYFLAASSPRAELGPLLVLLNEAPHIPQAAQLGRLAKKRGAQLLPDLPQRQHLSYIPGSPIRSKPKVAQADIFAQEVRDKVRQFIKTDDPRSAEMYLTETGDSLSPGTLTEMQQRVAWSYYIENDDRSALRMAQQAQRGSGEWVVHADWVAGLAAWRLDDCITSGAAFDNVGQRASNKDLKVAGLYWGSRADLACGRPERVQDKLRQAATYSDSFYGLLAAQ